MREILNQATAQLTAPGQMFELTDAVVRGGENIYCSEVEAAIYNFTGIAECWVFSVPDDRLGEEVGAGIFASPDVDINPDELRDFLKEKLAAFEIPRYIWLLEAPIPKNASGKFVKRELQEQLEIDLPH
jgi:steroid-24-oyl-CoA synthetase